jgi:hypothetical protein
MSNLQPGIPGNETLDTVQNFLGLLTSNFAAFGEALTGGRYGGTATL